MMIVIRGRGIQIRGDEVPIGPPLSQSICRHLLSGKTNAGTVAAGTENESPGFVTVESVRVI